jgi:hypothetical protein
LALLSWARACGTLEIRARVRAAKIEKRARRGYMKVTGSVIVSH